MRRLYLVLAALVVAPFVQVQAVKAETVNILGGITELTVTADLGALGLTPAATGTASLEGATFGFPITGGSVLADGNALIEHEGVGVSLTAGDTTAEVGNFLIDTAQATIFGTVGDGTDFAGLFDLGPATDDGIEVLIATPLAGALTSVFGAPDLSGAQFGFATVSPDLAPVPLPAGMPLLLVGLGAIGALRLRAKRAA